MIQRLCHRCRSVLHIENEGTLTFCWNCGAAQVTLSEELLEQAETQRKAFNDAADGTPSTVTSPHAADPLAVDWKSAIGITATVAAALTVLSGVIPPLVLLAWIAPAVILTIYAARHRKRRITTALGARVGMLSGLFTGIGFALSTTLRLLLLRGVMHRGDEFDSNVNTMLAQAKAQAVAQSGQAAADTFKMFYQPEFRTGFILAALAMGVLVLLVLSTLGGAFAGFVRSRTPQIR